MRRSQLWVKKMKAILARTAVFVVMTTASAVVLALPYLTIQ
jgi:hypothetical protein